MRRVTNLIGLLGAIGIFQFVSTAADVWADTYRFTKIVDMSTPAPFGTFDSFGVPAVSGETVAFRANYFDDEHSGAGIFTGSGGPLNTIAKRGDSFAHGTFESPSSDPSMSGQTVAFQSVYLLPDGENLQSGVFTSAGGPPTTIAKTGDAAPPGTLSSEFGNPSISNSTVAFRGGFTNDKKGILRTCFEIA